MNNPYEQYWRERALRAEMVHTEDENRIQVLDTQCSRAERDVDTFARAMEDEQSSNRVLVQVNEDLMGKKAQLEAQVQQLQECVKELKEQALEQRLYDLRLPPDGERRFRCWE